MKKARASSAFFAVVTIVIANPNTSLMSSSAVSEMVCSFMPMVRLPIVENGGAVLIPFKIFGAGQRTLSKRSKKKPHAFPAKGRHYADSVALSWFKCSDWLLGHAQRRFCPTNFYQTLHDKVVAFLVFNLRIGTGTNAQLWWVVALA